MFQEKYTFTVFDNCFCCCSNDPWLCGQVPVEDLHSASKLLIKAINQDLAQDTVLVYITENYP